MKKFSRKTVETEVTVTFGADKTEVDTTIPFLDHMLKTLAKHSGYGIVVRAKGDSEHHIIEDVAICLGNAIGEVGKKGIERFGDAIVPMDDAVAICGLDFSGRGVFVFDGEIRDGEMRSEDFLHFLDTLCRNAGLNIYLRVKGSNSHHMMEAAFKALAISLRKALKKSGEDYRSAKGVLD
ncbi:MULTISPECIES: imidazoleglycerol-phosphate dehydratase [unclassified Archaeoglobus]|jgi:imidazoleglycerol-phosphate dehydratase|uniref:imidazoleglycerol-phosphate dehydratase n=1 Tax=unclassified Archaeoglobus TaxID=2643606 RepID=UPI0025C434B4|nr:MULTISPECIES: imidazoleglycerol-phosphate dehydratase [unclassified Archaeoglobus]